MKVISKRARLKKVFQRMTEAPAVDNAEDALRLLSATLNTVENEHSGVPNDPTGSHADDRMFAPIERFRFTIEGRPDLVGYRQRRHDTILGRNGAIAIRFRKTQELVFEKAGRDGRKVDL